MNYFWQVNLIIFYIFFLDVEFEEDSNGGTPVPILKKPTTPANGLFFIFYFFFFFFFFFLFIFFTVNLFIKLKLLV
jgi:hypothetical protein